jgi:CxxC-x17-CxxC domain-containing protein
MALKKFGGKRPHLEMYHGHWTCSGCGSEITELPFEPTPGRPVYCKECWAKKRAEKGK